MISQLVTISVVLVLLSPGALGKADTSIRFLAETNAEQESGIEKGRSGRVIGGTTSLVPPLLALTIVKIDPICSWGDLITYDLEIRNRGKVTVDFPVSEDERDVGEPPLGRMGFVKATVALRLKDRGSPLIGGNIHVAYASQRVPFSAKLLDPGESVVIRGQTQCIIDDGTFLSSVHPEVVETEVVAELSLHVEPHSVGVALRSLPVRLSVIAPSPQ